MAGSIITKVDTGLGTTYERWALNRVLLQLRNTYGFSSVLEGPGDGMTGIAGINSLILGMEGVNVTLIMESDRAAFAFSVWKEIAPQTSLKIIDSWDDQQMPAEKNSYDLVWNFNILTYVVNPESLLSEMSRISRKYVFICLPNCKNYSFWIRYLHASHIHQPIHKQIIERMRLTSWLPMFSNLGLKILQVIWLDCPWWPDIIDPGQVVVDFFPFLKGFEKKYKQINHYCWTPPELPYYQKDRYADLHVQLDRLSIFEKSKNTWLKQRFAHHFGIFAEKQ